MKRHITIALASLCFSFSALSSSDDFIEFSGFGTIAAGKVISEESLIPKENQFLANYQSVSVYDTNIAFDEETRFGGQIKVNFSEEFSFTAQAVSRASEDFDLSSDWAFFTYSPVSNLKIQVGRKRIPMFYYSEHFDISYAYPWIRPPGDMYTWQIYAYNGISAELKSQISKTWTLKTSLYAGEETDSDSKLLKNFFGFSNAKESWKNIYGATFSLANKNFEISYRRLNFDRTLETDSKRTLFPNGKSYLDSASIHYEHENYFALAEYGLMNLAGGERETYLVSAGVTFDNLTPYLSTSSFKDISNPGAENHKTISLGLRFDIQSTYAIKLQFDRVKDDSDFLPVTGDVDAISLSLDFVF